MLSIMAKVGEGGRVVIPAEYRKALGIHVGDELVVLLEDGQVKLLTVQQAVKEAQALIKRRPRGSGLASEELIRERRAEAARE
jgi:AbrB family looped-hinge helix DNA binding protein